MDITLSGTGPGGATTSGTIKVDTAKCKKYPIGGSITTAKGAASARITFNDNCNGTFGFYLTGGQQFRFDFPFYDCYGGWWYWWGSLWLVAENGRLALDNSDDEPYNMMLSGNATSANAQLTFSSTCRTPGCDRQMHVYGTFNGHFWKDEPSGTYYKLRYYAGTLTVTFVHYNKDGSVFCEDTRVWNEQDGMDGKYEFYEVTRNN